MTAWREARFKAADGTTLAYREAGQGRTVLMLHGFMSNAEQNFIQPKIADAVIGAGFRVVAPDLRGHGASDRPSDPKFWPKDILADDQFALIAHLGLSDYDLVGYSLGARTAARMMVRGATPRRAVLGGMGASGIMEAGARAEAFEDGLRNGARAKDPEAGGRMQLVLQHMGLNREALLGVLASFAPTSEADLRGIPVPTLALLGAEDDVNGSAEKLAAILPHGEAAQVPGDHLTAVIKPELAAGIVGFLTQ